LDKTPSESQQDSTVKTDLMETNWNESIETFEELGLSKNLLRGIYAYNFETPSLIQQKAILPIIKGHDLIAQAQSGTGKTGAFAIGTLHMVDPTLDETQVLVMAPTRELAKQIFDTYVFLSEHMKIKVVLLIGGTQVRQDVEKLKKGAHVVVGCPGRMLDMIQRKNISLTHLKFFVLDEADLMLSLGFIDKVREAITMIPPDTKVLLFSATMSEQVVELTTKFMTNPIKILIKKEEVTLKGIKQYFVLCQKKQKMEVLLDIYRNMEIAQAVIFCNGVKTVDEVSDMLIKKGHMVSAIYGDKDMTERDTVMNSFRTGATRVLVTTNLLARGIDVSQVNLVVNYDLPREKETYVHRIGRSGRLGKKGTAINIITPNEYDDLQELRKFYSTCIEELPTDLGDLK